MLSNNKQAQPSNW